MKTTTAALLFFFCVLGWTSVTAQAVGGPISLQEAYCLGHNQQAWAASWARFFNPTPQSIKKSLVPEKVSLEDLGVYFPQAHNTLVDFRVAPDGPRLSFSSMDAFFDWSCRNFTPRKAY